MNKSFSFRNKKVLLSLVVSLLMMTGGNAWAQTVIFSENMGTGASGNPSSTSYTGFENYGTLTFSGDADVRNNTNTGTCRYRRQRFCCQIWKIKRQLIYR